MTRTHKTLTAALFTGLSLLFLALFWLTLARLSSDGIAEAALSGSVLGRNEFLVREDFHAVPSAQTSKENELSHWELNQAFAISIPSLHVRAPVYLPTRGHWDAEKWESLEEQMQVGMTYGAVAYPHSAMPDMNGALIIAGHSSPPSARAENSMFGNLFAKLPDMKKGDTIRLSYGSETYEYAVEKLEIVPATEISILQQGDSTHALKLVTCFPVGTTKDRLVVTALRVEA